MGENSSYNAYMQMLKRARTYSISDWEEESLAALGNAELKNVALGWKELRKLRKAFVSRLWGVSATRAVDLIISRAARFSRDGDSVLRALVPMYDMLNHGVPNVSYSLINDAIEVRTLRTLIPGEQLFC